MTAIYGNDLAEDVVVDTTIAEVAEDGQQASIPETVESNGLKPGQWLKQLREQKSFSVEHVADRLYLDAGVVTALEEDNYAALPPPIFVRGYIRNYAKLLEVPSSDELVNAYNAIQPDVSLPTKIIAKKIKYDGQVHTVSSKDWRVQIFTYAFFLTVAVLLVLGGIRTLSNNQSTQNVPLPLEINNGAETEHSIAIPLPEDSTDETAYEPPSENSELDNSNNSANDVDEVTIAVTSTEDGNVQNETTVKPTFTAEQLHTVVVNYNADSWTRITDNTNEKVYEGIAKAGRSVTVTGEPPFKMRFGVVEGVTVEYKNELIVVATHPSRSGRSITIGEPLPDMQ